MEMVKKVTVSLLDDLDGKAADETVQFALDGVRYEIDLSEKNAKKLRSAFQPWVTAGRRTGGSRRRRGVRSASALPSKGRTRVQLVANLSNSLRLEEMGARCHNSVIGRCRRRTG
jgi:hypothetical protein